MQDYREESYKKRASSVASGAPTPSEVRSGRSGGSSSIPESDVSIKSSSVVSGGGQVAIQGRPSENVVYTPKKEAAKPTAPVSALSQQAPVQQQPGVEQVRLSPGLYGALKNQQGGRLGSPGLYALGGSGIQYASVERPSNLDFQRGYGSRALGSKIQLAQIRQAEISSTPKEFFGWGSGLTGFAKSSFGRAKQTPNFLKSAGYASLGFASVGASVAVSAVEQPAYAFFTPRRERELVGTYSDRYGYEPGQRIESQQRVGQFQTGLLAAGFTAKMPARNVMVESRIATRQLVGEQGSVSTSKIFGKVEYETGFIRNKKVVYDFSGKSKDVAVRTKGVGRVSGDPIYRTTSSASIEFSQGGKTKYFGNIKGLGGEVGGFGQRKVATSIKTPRFGFTKNRESYVESYTGIEIEDIIYGGSVSKKGVSFYTGQKLLQADTTVQGRGIVTSGYYDPVLGIRNLERGTPFIEATPRSSSGTVKVLDIRSAAQSATPESAVFTQRGIVSRLRAERPLPSINLGLGDVRAGSVNAVAREQASDGLSTVQVSSVKQALPSGGLQQSITRLAEGVIPKQTPVLTTLSQKNFGKVSQKSYQVSTPVLSQRVNLRSLNATSSVIKSEQTLGSTAFTGLSQTFSPRSSLRRGSAFKNVPSPIQGTRQAQFISTATAHLPRMIQTPRTRPLTPYTPTTTPPPFTPPLVPPFRFDADLSGNWGTRNFKASRVTAYTPSFSALFYNIRGSYKAGKLGKSGIDFRPITKSFSIFGGAKRYSI